MFRPDRSGLVYAAPIHAVMFPDESTVEPDLLIVSAERFLHIITLTAACEGPPDLLVEILSPSNTRHDLETKRELYARHGVPMYLIVDADAESVRALTEPIIDGNVGILHGGSSVPHRRHCGHRRDTRPPDRGVRHIRIAAVARVPRPGGSPDENGAGSQPAPKNNSRPPALLKLSLRAQRGNHATEGAVAPLLAMTTVGLRLQRVARCIPAFAGMSGWVMPTPSLSDFACLAVSITRCSMFCGTCS